MFCDHGLDYASECEKNNPRTNARMSRVERNWTKSGGRLFCPNVLLVGELTQVSYYSRPRFKNTLLESAPRFKDTKKYQKHGAPQM